LRTTHLLALAVDLPHMTADHLQFLWRLAERGRAVIPQEADYFEPLCAIYPTEACILAGESLAAGRYSLQSLAHALIEKGLMRPYPLKTDELPLYHNTNRPEDLKSAS
jgi:molybdopterin-guanine dinucleotide biosynthesis protein A